VSKISDRKHLTSREVERLIEATKGRRNEVRDRCLLFLMFRYGLRVSEACGIKLDQVDMESRVLHVARLKGGLIDDASLTRYELRAVGHPIEPWRRQRRMRPANWLRHKSPRPSSRGVPTGSCNFFSDDGPPWQTSSALGCKVAEGLTKFGRNDEAIQMLDALEM
jgi:integrase